MTVIIQAYQFALDPAPEQEAMLRSHCGAQRYAFNWGLARITANLGQREAEKSYGITGDDLTRGGATRRPGSPACTPRWPTPAATGAQAASPAAACPPPHQGPRDPGRRDQPQRHRDE